MAQPMVLVVDDQPEYARLISMSLTREGFDARTACGGEEAINLASDLHPDVVLLDIHMPGMDGFDVMSDLRRRWRVPIIMVTGQDTVEQRRTGLDQGADDYVTKPFAPAELAARVRAVLRRKGVGGLADGAGVAILPPAPDTAGGPRKLSLRRSLGRPGWRLLELLTGNPDKVLYHDELLAHAFGPEFVGDASLVQELIRRVRRALGVPAGSDGPIRTVRGVGYVYDPSGRRPPRRTRAPHISDRASASRTSRREAPAARALTPGGRGTKVLANRRASP